MTVKDYATWERWFIFRVKSTGTWWVCPPRDVEEFNTKHGTFGEAHAAYLKAVT